MPRPKGSLNKYHIDKIKLICPTCNKEFWEYPSIVKHNKIRKCLIYCSRKCSDKNRKKIWKKFGEQSSNYKNGESAYRNNALRIKGFICEKCGYDGNLYKSLIWIHHKDFSKRTTTLNRNNTIENLEVLCIRCHLENHLKIKK